ncbi:MAG: hypothetical protein JO033_06370 [Acidobacteriaceae bacterium]|nr:hypothetical protein [Acidobacteriaceae bacterium]MBV9501714.1 hypothetical protein [Acidobacteriaceae bacterium]
MKTFFCASLLLIPVLALPQNTEVQTVTGSVPSAKVTKIVRVHHGNARNLAELAAHGSNVSAAADNALQAIVLTGNTSDVSSVEQMVKELDTAAASSRDFELTIWAIGGSNDPESAPEGQIPESIAPVVKQLRAIFPYKTYDVLSTMLIRSREGTSAGNGGVMHAFSKTPSAPFPSTYNVHYADSTVSMDERTALIHLHDFRFVTHVPVGSGSQWQNEEVSIQTDVDLRDGQKVVVGKSNVGSSDSALFVVLSARLVQ